MHKSLFNSLGLKKGAIVTCASTKAYDVVAPLRIFLELKIGIDDELAYTYKTFLRPLNTTPALP